MKMNISGTACCSLGICLYTNSGYILDNGKINKDEVQKITDRIEETAQKYGVTVGLNWDDLFDEINDVKEDLEVHTAFVGVGDARSYYVLGDDDCDVDWNYEFELEKVDFDNIENDCSQNLYGFLREIESYGDEGYSIEAYEKYWKSIGIDNADPPLMQFQEDYEGTDGGLRRGELDRLRSDLKQYAKDLGLEQSQKKQAVKDER